MQKSRVQKLVSVSMLSAIGVVLQLIAFPIIPFFLFLTLDFSDIPVLIGMFLFGPGAGVAIAFIRSVLHLFIQGLALPNFIGNAASFLATLCFTLPIYALYQKGQHKSKFKFGGLFLGIASMTLFMSVANYFVITPLYLKLFGTTADAYLQTSLARYIAVGIVPFNLIKGVVVSGVFMVLHTSLLPWLKKKQLAPKKQKLNS